MSEKTFFKEGYSEFYKGMMSHNIIESLSEAASSRQEPNCNFWLLSISPGSPYSTAGSDELGIIKKYYNTHQSNKEFQESKLEKEEGSLFDEKLMEYIQENDTNNLKKYIEEKNPNLLTLFPLEEGNIVSMSFIHYAIMMNHSECVKVLLEHGADADAIYQGPPLGEQADGALQLSVSARELIEERMPELKDFLKKDMSP